MSLSWKDAAATFIVVTAAAITYAKVKGWQWPLVGSWRGATLVLLLLGLGACIVIGSGTVPVKNSWTTAAAALGGLAFVLAILGVITGSKLAFFMHAADIFILWAVTTFRHIITSGVNS